MKIFPTYNDTQNRHFEITFKGKDGLSSITCIRVNFP